MRLIIKDLIFLVLIAVAYNAGHMYLSSSGANELYTTLLSNTPYFLIMSLLFYALINVFLNIIFINDCEKEYDELIIEINKEETKLRKNKIISW